MLMPFAKKKHFLLSYTTILAIVFSLLVLFTGLFQVPLVNAISSHTNAISDTSIVFVHGIQGIDFGSVFRNGASDGVDCGPYWKSAKDYFEHGGNIQSPVGNLWGGDLRTVQYYSGDRNCDVNLHSNQYQEHCAHYANGSEGTNNESLFHISCLLAWYLYYNFGQKGSSEILVGHSMGGLIIREAIYQVQNRISLHTGSTFPPTIGHVTEAITADTPHNGFNLLQVLGQHVIAWVCGNCQQIIDMGNDSLFMTELKSKGQDPQAGGTDWTLMGSQCDNIVLGGDAVSMDGANHIIGYRVEAGLGDGLSRDMSTCYAHTDSLLVDTENKMNAVLYYCDTNNVQVRKCTIDNWHLTTAGPHGLQAILQVIMSNGYSPVSVMQNSNDQ